MPVRVVFFDWGGTLNRTWSDDGRPPAEFWQAILARHRVRLDPVAVRHALEETDRELDARIYEYLGRTPEFWHLYDDRVLDRLGLRDEREVLAPALERSFREAARGELYPDSVPTLTELRGRGLTLGIISNNNDELLEVLRYHRLHRFFETVTYSQEVGAEKPDRRVFDLALTRAHCTPHEAVYVGNSWEADYLGARGVGMRAIWLNRLRVPPPAPCESVSELREVTALLSR